MEKQQEGGLVVGPIPDKQDLDLETGSTDINSQAPQSSTDPDVVDWDGPDDPKNPMNWPPQKKNTIVALISLITFITPLASSVFAPAINQVMAEFNSTDEQLASFIVSVYLLGFCFGPLVLAPLSEMYGRLWIYHICNVLFIVFNVACALAPNLAGLIIFRLLAGLFGCCPLTLGAGSIADIIPQERRGAAMAFWAMGPILGPIIGPIAGGYLTQAKDWRWTFWVVAMLAGVITIIGVVFMRETYAYTILEKKTKKLRAETGNEKLRSAADTGVTPQELFSTSIIRPTKMLLFSPIILLLSLYMAIIYGYLYLLFTAMPTLYAVQYGFSTGSIGLTYIGSGIGSILGLALSGGLSDRLMTRLTAKNGGEPKPEYRLPTMVIASFFVPLGLFVYGWTAEKNLHWILPIVGMGFLSFGMMCAFMGISVYIVDAYTRYAASAMSATTVLRSLVGALLPLVGGRMYNSLGYGWGTSLLAFIAVAMIPVPIVFLMYGERIRQKTFFNVNIY
ncbi:unnamed protein product [Clonostachys chloroleuca]|uniref:Major facilitator superfamily (MFS) profile domain-containing protein n=1 Tax=Clonostachys chloroleuca TaxID=1926264 RepID=A0AA35QD28_9HYPO|nr:unnamed protein product [Clonostachys chloroleuca]